MDTISTIKEREIILGFMFSAVLQSTCLIAKMLLGIMESDLNKILALKNLSLEGKEPLISHIIHVFL